MRAKFVCVTTTALVLLTIAYFVYYGVTVSTNNGIGPRFFYGTITLYLCGVIGLIYSSCHYTNLMKSRWGDSFDQAIRRVNLISAALIIGYIASAGLLLALTRIDDNSKTQLALTTCI